MWPKLLASELVDLARQYGFEHATALPLAALADPSLTLWLRQGYGGAMHYLEPHAGIRSEPTAEFPEFHTAVVVALEYGNVADAPRNPTLGNLSRYVAAEDYHVIMRRRLHDMADHLRTAHPNMPTRPFVDSNPLNEKVAAALGGLGFIGKNTNLIIQGQGSYCFLGILLLGAECDGHPAPVKERCGTCTRCIPACPTQAILAPYVLDARRCISYLTIEWAGVIPKEFRTAIGNRIFGCDDCQEVCPWNRFAHRGPKEPFMPKAALQGRSLADWASLGADGFASTFATSSVLRIGWPSFRRNVLIAIGNSCETNLIPHARAALTAPEVSVRATAIWALGQLGDFAQLKLHRASEKDPAVLHEINDALVALES